MNVYRANKKVTMFALVCMWLLSFVSFMGKQNSAIGAELQTNCFIHVFVNIEMRFGRWTVKMLISMNASENRFNLLRCFLTSECRHRKSWWKVEYIQFSIAPAPAPATQRNASDWNVCIFNYQIIHEKTKLNCAMTSTNTTERSATSVR